jgi:hypothetical protein
MYLCSSLHTRNPGHHPVNDPEGVFEVHPPLRNAIHGRGAIGKRVLTEGLEVGMDGLEIADTPFGLLFRFPSVSLLYT